MGEQSASVPTIYASPRASSDSRVAGVRGIDNTVIASAAACRRSFEEDKYEVVQEFRVGNGTSLARRATTSPVSYEPTSRHPIVRL
ncbi:hypothetical protein ACFDR1_12620 [Bradyrhizobium sp. 1AS5L]